MNYDLFQCDMYVRNVILIFNFFSDIIIDDQTKATINIGWYRSSYGNNGDNHDSYVLNNNKQKQKKAKSFTHLFQIKFYFIN